MTTLSKLEKQELLADAESGMRKLDFDKLSVKHTKLSPAEYIDFLNWASTYSTERPEDRNFVVGTSFLL